MGKMTRITWPPEYAELQRIDELLLCGICYDYMETSVMTPCSHNYCSLCIRKYLHYKTQCPACFEKTFEKDLHTNRILDELISYFGKIREKLVDCIVGAKIEESSDADVDDSPRLTPVRPARSHQNQKKTPSPKANAESNLFSPTALQKVEKLSLFADSLKTNAEQNAFAPNTPYRVEKLSLFAASPKTNAEQNAFAPNTPHKVEKVSLFAASPTASQSTSGAAKVAKIFTPKSKNNAASGSSRKTVPCPVCRVEVSEVHVNKHLDDCLKRETVTQQRPRIEPKRKPLPKLVFSLMKDAELRKKMKELGLPSQGDRKTLEGRFQRYSILYNAECDKIEPRSVDELLKQCEEEENLEKKMLKFSQAANRLKVTRNSEHNVIEEAQKKYLETNKQNYDSLIAAIKDREKSVKLPVRRSLINQNDILADGESTEKEVLKNNFMRMNESEDEDDPDGAYLMNDYTTCQDSDSSSCCPLQHYASDDPIRIASIQMTNSNDNSPSGSPAKSNLFKMRRSDDKLSDSPASSAKNISLNDRPFEKIMENPSKDICDLTTDDESNDEDIVPPSPRAATQHTTKRPKLSLQQIQKSDDVKAELKQNLSEGQKMHRSGDKLFDALASPDKNIAINDRPSEKIVENPSKDVCSLAIDSESNDEDTVPQSPKAATRRTSKRLKLSLQKIQKTDDAKAELKYNLSEGQKLALSIIQDFTFDETSNDGVGNEAAYETADTKTTKTPSAVAPKAENSATDISNRDKENQKSSASSSTTVNRPMRKRNCVTRTRKNDTVESTKLKESSEVSVETDALNAEKVENPPRVDSPLKRRRGRKAVTPVENEAKNPPRRPLRKRNSVVTESAHKRS